MEVIKWPDQGIYGSAAGQSWRPRCQLAYLTIYSVPKILHRARWPVSLSRPQASAPRLRSPYTGSQTCGLMGLDRRTRVGVKPDGLDSGHEIVRLSGRTPRGGGQRSERDPKLINEIDP